MVYHLILSPKSPMSNVTQTNMRQVACESRAINRRVATRIRQLSL